MLKTLYFLFALTWLSFLSAPASAEQMPALTEKLREAGFENIRTWIQQDVCYVSIENKRYRSDARALGEALNTIIETLHDSLTINLVLLDKGQPQLLVSVNSEIWRAFSMDQISKTELSEQLSVTRAFDEAWAKIRPIKADNRSAGKTDLVIYPDFAYQNTRLDKLYETRIGVAPALEHTFWKGNKVVAQVIFPIHNELGHEGDYIRPGYLTLTQEFRPAPRTWMKLSVGNFSNNRYGTDARLNHAFTNENWNLDMKAGYTGYSYFYEQKWEHGSINSFTWSAAISWLYPKWNLVLKGGAARYIFGDHGIFASGKRYFGETAVEIYAQLGNENINGGFIVNLPLPLHKRSKRKILRVCIPEYINFAYNAGTEFYYGQTYSPSPIDNKGKMINFPTIIKNQLVNF